MIKNFKLFEATILQNYSEEDLFNMIKNTYTVDGYYKKYKQNILDDIINYIKTFNNNELEQMWIGYKLTLGEIDEIPDDFDQNIYNDVILKLQKKGNEIADYYINK